MPMGGALAKEQTAVDLCKVPIVKKRELPCHAPVKRALQTAPPSPKAISQLAIFFILPITVGESTTLAFLLETINLYTPAPQKE